MINKSQFIKLLLITKLCALTLLISCTTTYTRHDFKNQVLIARGDYIGKLVNQLPENNNMSVIAYDITDKRFRDSANAAGFFCVSTATNKFYYLCPDDPGICRRTMECDVWERNLFSKKCAKYHVEYLDAINDFDIILAIGIECRVF